MNNNENINWREMVAAFSSYEGTLISFCNINHISKSQLYYYRKKFEKEDSIKFHAISMIEERVKTEITVAPTDRPSIRIEIGNAKIYVPANEMAVLSILLKDLITNV
ncbi:IS66 family insertion sequence element accessory protein TnpA [Clostridium saccharobutylicum]|uniref:Transposase n=1 Tax=Clostridium saccharobutylicum TaxID=169679 RepID=A0A1S8N2C6_CLOSA|nr:hypothetical protein [Clostridium saccharobutylicum]OOM06310.1 hypothetical protein CLOSAC_42290 [Clostridium saccharobutylicum]OOM06318.1 hypothetical protein CLOSAC_42370 [Clostridium saccharobutylicum]OOM06774.1 hypothetical protein CLOSAC_42040 [Clostridium saccharobutylicum]OOM10614.1 hypothetical protein CLOSAC_32350 [Clostridium saccharobutylicum]OOM11648.1 hypothetical protein CLOSAC_20750 [Clostridium saccharobutylicum]